MGDELQKRGLLCVYQSFYLRLFVSVTVALEGSCQRVPLLISAAALQKREAVYYTREAVQEASEYHHSEGREG